MADDQREQAVRTPRSWLFVPGANERHVAKLAATPRPARPDAILLDLEDGVAATDLDRARERVHDLLSRADAPSHRLAPVVAVRTHAVPDSEFARDLTALGPGLTALVLPKVRVADEVQEALAGLGRVGLQDVGLMVIVESAAGLQGLPTILAAAAERPARSASAFTAVAFGAEDFAADLGLPPNLVEAKSTANERGSVHERSPEHLAAAGRQVVLDAARARIVTAAAAAGVSWRIDSPVLQLRATALVEAEARRSRALGFSGKFCIHPAHIEPLHRGFEPSAGEAAWARAVLGWNDAAGAADSASAENAAEAGSGATQRAGQMVDEAVARQARAVLAARREPN